MADHQELLTAIEAVKDAPSEAANWDRVEELVDAAQRPTDVKELFRSVLSEDMSPELVSDIGQRAMRFYESWYGEDSHELPETLERVLQIDPNAQWAFERLTVAYTVAEKWDALLSAYDKAIAAADQTARRMQLLDEAAQAAKDFAGQLDRAIGYMNQLFALDPSNTTLADALERLLERQERWADLVVLYEARIGTQTKAQARATRLRMASCYLERLTDAGNALDQAKAVLADASEYAPAYSMVEEVLAAANADASVRTEALSILKEHHLKEGDASEVVRVMEVSLEFVEGDERRATLRELVARLLDASDDVRAMPHQAALLVQEPLPQEREALHALATRTRDFEQYQAALLEAAERVTGRAQLDFWMEAARTLEQDIGDEPRAIDCYRKVFDAETAGELAVAAGRRLLELLGRTDRDQETLETMSRMTELEPDEAVRKRLLGQVARLADKLGDSARAREAWRTRVGDDTHDVEALDALVATANAEQEYEQLAKLLRQRIQAPGAADRRRDDMAWLARVLSEQLGDVAAAIEVWREVQATFGEDHQTVTALTDLLSRAERWPELAEVLQQAATREIERFTELQAQLGDAFRLKLGKPADAVERYRSALQVDPTHALARTGQHALLDVDDCRAVAAESLAEAYEQTDEWQAIVGLLEVRLETEPAPTVRAQLLLEAAELQEQRGGDVESALTYYRRAFALAPDDRATERDIRRLAEQLDRWDAVVEAYRDTIATFEKEGSRVAELRFEEGQVLERRLSDAEGALSAYRKAADITPTRVDFAVAVVMRACEVGRPEEACARVLTCAAANSELPEELPVSLEEAAERYRVWDALTQAMTSALEGEGKSLSKSLQRDLHARVADWHLGHREDPTAAEASLQRAVKCDPTHLPTLQSLAALQRAQPGTGLVGTLLRMADLDLYNLDALYEAAAVTVEHVAMPEQRMTILGRLHGAATSLFKQGREATGEQDAQGAVIWALEHLVQLHREAKESTIALQLLTDAVTLPFEPEAVQGLRHQAAELAADVVKDRQRAIELYRDILRHDPRDAAATHRLAELYRADDRLPELLMLRHHELSLGPDAERCLDLRLEISHILGEMEARGGRLQSLEANLEQEPGHAASLKALSKLLRDAGQHAELAALMEVQAKRLARAGATSRAASLWREVAIIHEVELSDVQAAIAAYEALHDVEPLGDASESLARLHSARGEHARAAEWLELRLGTAPPETRGITAIELARAHVEAKQPERARGCLEQALAQDPNAHDARELLAKLYRDAESYEQLARLLEEGAERAPSEEQALAYLTEVAEIYHKAMGTPVYALSALQHARKLAPEDQRLGVMEARSLHAAGRYDEAAALLQEFIERFGRKRSPQRAELHYQLARVLSDGGDEKAALSELETATKMDLAHAPALYMLARLSQRGGDLDAAERAYRGLLMLVRRKHSSDLADVGPSEVFYALYGIAVERGDTEQAEEYLQSALEAAAQTDIEAQRFQRAVLEKGEASLLLKVLDSRERLAQGPEAQADILSTRATVLEQQLDQSEEALKARLSAIELCPRDAELHRAARKLAVRLDSLQRYLDLCSSVAEQGTREGGDGARLAAELTLRMGEAIEQELGDLDRATGLYAKVEASGHMVVAAWLALARVAGARGEAAEQRRVLLRISELDDKQASQQERNEALFILTDLELDTGAVAVAMGHLAAVLSRRPDYERAKVLLQRALTVGDDPSVLPVMEQVARASHDDALLLEWYERLAAADDANLAQVREGIDLGLRLGELARVERLLERAAQLARASDDRATTSWVFSGLSECRMQAGDVKAAIAYMDEAISHADEDDAHALRVELAQLASSEGGDLDVAARAYEALLARDPGNRTVWEPLLSVYGRMGDRDRFEGFIERVLQALLPEEDRAFLLLTQARFLIERAKAEKDAAPVLQTLLDEQPTHLEATDLLTGIYQRNGMNDALANLLSAQFDRARDEQNLSVIGELGLRLGELYGPDQRDVAMDVYRAALEWVPEHAGLLRAMLARMDAQTEPRERGEAMQGLLKSATGEEASRLAREAMALWNQLDEPDLAQQALELGCAGAPDDADLRGQLEGHYARHELWRPLAELMMREAERLGDTTEAVARYKNAANLYREQLDDTEGAASALRAAVAIVPDDLTLLGELARNLAAAGQHETAIADVTNLLEQQPEPDSVRVDLLRVRADLYRAIDAVPECVQDLEEAYAVAPSEVARELVAALEQLRHQAERADDRDAERAAMLRSLQVLDRAGDPDRARDILAAWVEQSPEDVESLRALRRRDEVAENWDGVAHACDRLIDIEQGEARAEAALGLADACQRAGRQEDALGGLERVYMELPDNALLRGRLRELYRAVDAKRELANILLQDAEEAGEAEQQVSLFQQAAALLIEMDDPEAALDPLSRARALSPEDQQSTVLMIDIHTKLGQLDEAAAMLDEAIESHKRKRSPELALLQQRMARLCQSRGDADGYMDWLNQALDTDRKSGEIAAELAEGCLAIGDYDGAMKALRSITMMEDPQPISRAQAFLKQAEIAADRGDTRRAQHWARKAKSLDDSLAAADDLLERLG